MTRSPDAHGKTVRATRERAATPPSADGGSVMVRGFRRLMGLTDDPAPRARLEKILVGPDDEDHHASAPFDGQSDYPRRGDQSAGWGSSHGPDGGSREP